MKKYARAIHSLAVRILDISTSPTQSEPIKEIFITRVRPRILLPRPFQASSAGLPKSSRLFFFEGLVVSDLWCQPILMGHFLPSLYPYRLRLSSSVNCTSILDLVRVSLAWVLKRCLCLMSVESASQVERMVVPDHKLEEAHRKSRTCIPVISYRHLISSPS